ncbi:hypothetical protein FJU08_01420 [Martelella alba]|uniref:Uncharacterized protein n=1 Tax=Martelella alba TaxID=2590451 RepID=A0A506UIU3_9HYPH|nr:hypothetical protein [Martelella alba]TPW33251.1 hypothetical protein FJU08_01420 [Martelella alba]
MEDVTNTEISPITRLGAKLNLDSDVLPRIITADVPGFTWLNDIRQLSIEGPESGLLGSETNPQNYSNTAATFTNLATTIGDLDHGLRIASTGATYNRGTLNSAVARLAGDTIFGHCLIVQGTSATAALTFRNKTTLNASTAQLTFSTGVVTAPTTYAGTITNTFARELGGGLWWLGACWTMAADAADGFELGAGPYSATTGEYVDLWAMQAELSTRPSGIIPNITTSAGVRAEDQCLLNDKDIALFNRDQWTMVLDFVPYKTETGVYTRAIDIVGSTQYNSNRFSLTRNGANGRWLAEVFIDGASQGNVAALDATYAFAQRARVAVSKTPTELKICGNGGTVYTNSAITGFPAFYTGRIGSAVSGGAYINLLCNEFAIYDGAATDAALQTLSATS